jgi:hypothetical protein
MTFEEIADQFETLRKQQLSVVDPSMSNYRHVLNTYKQILNDMCVLGRELAQNLQPADPQKLPKAGSFE